MTHNQLCSRKVFREFYKNLFTQSGFIKKVKKLSYYLQNITLIRYNPVNWLLKIEIFHRIIKLVRPPSGRSIKSLNRLYFYLFQLVLVIIPPNCKNLVCLKMKEENLCFNFKKWPKWQGSVTLLWATNNTSLARAKQVNSWWNAFQKPLVHYFFLHFKMIYL